MYQSLAALLALLASIELASADLGAALRRASAGQGAATAPTLPAQAALQRPVAIELTKKSSVSSPHGIDATFYTANVTVGHPAQSLEVMFDTGSGSVLLPHRACQSAACKEHRRYSPWQSATAMDVGINGAQVQKGQRLAKGAVMRDVATIGFSQADLGDGEAKTVLVRDSVCVKEDQSCVDMPLLAAISMDDKPFAAMPSDGIIGLGMEALSPKGCSFLSYLFEGATGVSKVFGVYLGADRGQLMLGDVNAQVVSEPITWLPVDHPAEGYWQVAINSVRVGGVVMDSCASGCHGVVDTGASRLGVQQTVYDKIHTKLLGSLSAMAGGGCQGPSVEIDLGSMVLTLGAEDYSDVHCEPLIGSLNLEEPKFVGVYSLGEAVLRHYYAAFDWENQRVGFARVAEEPKGAPAAGFVRQTVGLPVVV